MYTNNTLDRGFDDEFQTISIIIPVYNSSEYLRNCLNSVQQQKYNNIEVIIIDDGSKDNSKMICKEFVKSDSRFILHSLRHQGVSATRNYGLKIASGQYVVFLDSDDSIKNSYLQNLYKEIHDSAVDLVICDYNQVDVNSDTKDMEHYVPKCGLYQKKSYINQLAKCPGAHYFGVLWNKIYRMDIIQKENIQFDTRLELGEDFDFNMKYLAAIHQIRVIPDKLYTYYWNRPSSLTHAAKSVEQKVSERILLYHSYRNLYVHERLDVIWFYKLHYYMYKAYFEETKNFDYKNKKLKRYYMKKYLIDEDYALPEIVLVLMVKKIINIRRKLVDNKLKVN